MKKNCNSSISHTCGSINYATCTVFEGDVNSQSELIDETCLSIQDTTQDQYDQLGNIWSEIDLSDLSSECLTYVQESGKTIVKNVLLKFEEEICLLKERVNFLETEDLCSKNITNCGFDFSCLELPCENSIITFGQLIEALITKVCE